VPLIRPYIALVLFRVEARIAEMIAGRVVVGSAIAEQTDAVPARRIIWRRAAITAPSPAGSLETRDRITSRPYRGRGESETDAKAAGAETIVNASGAALVEPV
jgi:hypothetical protein